MSTKDIRQPVAAPANVIVSDGTAEASNVGYRALGSFKGDLGLGTSLTQTANNGNGTATDPAFTFTGDTNTGIIRAAADELGFVTNGSEKVRIDDTGNVGIGTTNPSYKLQVQGSTFLSNILSLGNAAIQKRGYFFAIANAANTGVNIPTSDPMFLDVTVAYTPQINANNCVLARKFLFSRPGGLSTGRLDEYATASTSVSFSGSLTCTYNASTGNIEVRKTAGSINTNARFFIVIDGYIKEVSLLPDLSTFTY